MPNESLIAKATIIGNTVKEDQAAVAKMWWKTFKHNPGDDSSTNMAKLMLACVALGDFKTSSSLSGKKGLDNPNPVLTSIDYLSHASRIIFDYKNLSETHQQEFLAYFPKAGEQGVIARSATHAAIRKGDETITELKGFLYGVVGQIPTYLKYAYDFGVNIAMGGSGQSNYTGKKISNNGYSGHMYFHHYFPDQLIMAGLEQSAPAAGLLDAIWGHSEESPDVQTGSDQYGQGHSLTGASDTYTAAGSLYFSDPVYQAKLLAETGALTPDKYGAMQVTLTNDNWPYIKRYLSDLNDNLRENREEVVMEQLLTPPSTASKKLPTVQSFIAFDFKGYLHNIRVLLEAEPLSSKQMETHLHLQNELLLRIQKLRQEGYTVKVYEEFLLLIREICALEDTPAVYKDAVVHIAQLFKLQCDVDPNLEKAHVGLLIQQRCNETLDTIKELHEKARILETYFSSEHISRENGVGDFLQYISEQMAVLERIETAITKGVVFEEANSLEKSLDLQDRLDKSWAKLNPIDLGTLNSYQDTLQRFAQSLRETPRLVSESLYTKLKLEHAKKEKLLEELHAVLVLSQTQAKELQTNLSSATILHDSKVQTLEYSLSEAQTEIRSLTKQLLSEQARIRELTENHSKARKEDREELLQPKTLEQQLQERLITVTLERDQLLQTKEQLEKKTSEHARLLEQYEQLQQRNTSLSRDLHSNGVALSKTRLELQTLLESQSSENERTQTTILGLQKELRKIRGENEQLNAQIQSLGKRISELTSQSRELDDKLRLQTEKLATQAEDFAVTKRELLTKQKELQELHTRALLDLESSTLRSTQLSERIERAETDHPQELISLRNELQQEQIRHDRLERDLQDKFFRLEAQKLEVDETILSKDRELLAERLLTQQLRREYIELQSAHSLLKQRVLRLDEEFSSERQEFIEQLEKETAQKEALQLKAQIIERSLSKALLDNSGLKEQVAQLTSQKRDNLQRIQTLEQRLQELTSQTATLSLDEKKKRQQLKKLLTSFAPIFMHLKEVEQQANDLSTRHFTGAAYIARKLVSNINMEIDSYLDVYDTDPKALINFKSNCNRHILDASGVLEQHRGWKWLLGNLSGFILSLGIGYIIAGAINMYFNQQFSFFNQTTSMEKVCGLKDRINEVNANDHIPMMLEV